MKITEYEFQQPSVLFGEEPEVAKGQPAPKIIHRLYNFENGYGALGVLGHPAHPDVWELHPVEIPRFSTSYSINYGIHPQIDDLAEGDLDEQIAMLKALTD